jgi:hypothetical protein
MDDCHIPEARAQEEQEGGVSSINKLPLGVLRGTSVDSLSALLF